MCRPVPRVVSRVVTRSVSGRIVRSRLGLRWFGRTRWFGRLRRFCFRRLRSRRRRAGCCGRARRSRRRGRHRWLRSSWATARARSAGHRRAGGIARINWDHGWRSRGCAGTGAVRSTAGARKVLVVIPGRRSALARLRSGNLADDFIRRARVCVMDDPDGDRRIVGRARGHCLPQRRARRRERHRGKKPFMTIHAVIPCVAGKEIFGRQSVRRCQPVGKRACRDFPQRGFSSRIVFSRWMSTSGSTSNCSLPRTKRSWSW